jgi:hypothetical protein
MTVKTKKELTESGHRLQKNGEHEKSLACTKQICEADYGYKDIAKRLERSYQHGKGGINPRECRSWRF